MRGREGDGCQRVCMFGVVVIASTMSGWLVGFGGEVQFGITRGKSRSRCPSLAGLKSWRLASSTSEHHLTTDSPRLSDCCNLGLYFNTTGRYPIHPSHLDIPSRSVQHGSQRPEHHLPLGDPRRNRLLRHLRLPLRCQGWLARSHLRPSVWCLRSSQERRNSLPDPMVAKGHHLRC